MPAQIWAHRGDSVNAPENTIPAFNKAIELGVDGIELDVRRTRDDVIVVSHDETINRCSNGRGDVSTMTLEMLRQYRFTNGKTGFANVTIPTLKEVLELIGKTQLDLNIELKKNRQADNELAGETVNLVKSMGLMERVIFSSFDTIMLEQVREISQAARIGVLFGMRQRAPWDLAKALAAEALHAPLARARMNEFIKTCHDANLLVRLWTVDAPAAIERTIKNNVDCIITNRPGLAMRIRSVTEVLQ